VVLLDPVVDVAVERLCVLRLDAETVSVTVVDVVRDLLDEEDVEDEDELGLDMLSDDGDDDLDELDELRLVDSLDVVIVWLVVQLDDADSVVLVVADDVLICAVDVLDVETSAIDSTWSSPLWNGTESSPVWNLITDG